MFFKNQILDILMTMSFLEKNKKHLETSLKFCFEALTGSYGLNRGTLLYFAHWFLVICHIAQRCREKLLEEENGVMNLFGTGGHPVHCPEVLPGYRLGGVRWSCSRDTATSAAAHTLYFTTFRLSVKGPVCNIYINTINTLIKQ